MNRRSILILVIALAVLGASAALWQQRSGSDGSLTVVSFGGAYQAAQRKAYMEPFSAQTGQKIVEGEYNGDYAVLKEHASAASGTWDVVSVESAPALRGEREGLFAPLPARIFDGLAVVPQAHRSAAAGHLQFATILAYRTDAPGAKPSSWKDFWDVAKFPGKRGLRNNPRGTLEVALMADGVAPSKLYPLDIDRAFRKLDQIRGQVVFWISGAQPIQLLANHVVAMTTVYNGRIWDARVNEKLPVGWSMANGLLEIEFWAVPRNSLHKEVAFDFIRFSLQPAQQASFSNTIAYMPTNSGALPLISAGVRQALPSGNNGSSQQAVVDADWWAANEAAVSARWQAWQIKQ